MRNNLLMGMGSVPAMCSSNYLRTHPKGNLHELCKTRKPQHELYPKAYGSERLRTR